ncbi:dihydrofolate reductase, partial [Burkholderia multivorans]
PGTDVEITRNGEYITVQVPGAEDVLDLPVETASHVFAHKR